MKYLKIIPLFCVLISAGCALKKDSKIAVSKQSDQLKVLCYNIHHANPPSKPGLIDLDAISRVITSSKADVVALQEVDKNIKRSGNIDQAKAIAEKTGMNYHFFKAIDYDGGEYGVAILSRYPLKDVQAFELPQKIKAENRILGQVMIRVGNQDVIFANTHLDATGRHDNRLAQMQYITALYKASKLPVIVSGDFNCTPDSEAIKLLDQEFKRTCTQNCPNTFPQINPKRVIDYIATKNINWSLLNYEVIEETYASDHRPIAATFKVN